MFVRGWHRGVDGETRNEDVAVAFARNRHDIVTEGLQGALPFRGFDGDPVSAAKAKTHKRDSGHG